MSSFPQGPGWDGFIGFCGPQRPIWLSAYTGVLERSDERAALSRRLANPDSRASVFVTGGTGFIGRRLVRRLLEDGDRVHLLSRRQSDLTGLQGEGVRVFRGDVTDRASLAPAMAGVLRDFHLAGCATNWARDPAIYFQVNVEGLRNVAEAALEQGVERMLFTSTSLTFGPSRGEEVDEQAQRTAPFFTEYERTKSLAEQEAERFVQRGLPIVVVNPTRVYGPGKMTEGNSVTYMVEMFLEGKFLPILGKGHEIGNYVHVDDLVEGHRQAMAKGRIGEKYILGGENCSFNQFFAVLSELCGREPPRAHIPAVGARAFAAMLELKARAFGGTPLISRPWVELFLHDWAFSSGKAASELGYRSRPLREGLAETCRWLNDGKPEER
jgi:nucleoside-diphosphate-sugar epimerase